jgi:hypothetical protein
MVLKNIDIHLGYCIAAIASFAIAWGTAQGTVQEYIHFADPLNEMAFCFAAICMGVICLPLAFSRNSNSSK